MRHLEPKAAWAYLQARPDALFVDVRMEIETLYVGHPPGVVHSFTEVVNVVHGFEGELDAHFQRGRLNGWRFDGLPWQQM